MSGFKLVNGVYICDKDPLSELDYGVRMYRWLVPGDTLNVGIPPVWEISDGLLILGQGVMDNLQTAFVKLKGGLIADELEWAQCTWWTTQGRKEVQTLYFNMVDK